MVAVLNCLVSAVGAVGVFGVGVGLVLCCVHGSDDTQHMHTLQYQDELACPGARDAAGELGGSPAGDLPGVVPGKSIANDDRRAPTRQPRPMVDARSL